MFTVDHRDGRARVGVLALPHGDVQTPVFMPVATAATLKGLESHHLVAMGYKLILANTYHLELRPGSDTVAALGGIRTMMNYPHNILTDSGGFQVFSLGALCKIDDDGVSFQNHINGGKMRLTPESVQAIQGKFQSTIAMPLDVCPPGDCSQQELENACKLTRDWYLRADKSKETLLFGIVQGGTNATIRDREMDWLLQQQPTGVALGGFSVGESREDFWGTIEAMQSWPDDIPVYAMGVGDPRDLVFCATHGVDMFDCVLPTRNARNGRLYVDHGYYNVRRAELANLNVAPDPTCSCTTCASYSVGYLRHLCIANELTYFTLATVHNLHKFSVLMNDIRDKIAEGKALEYNEEYQQKWRGSITPAAPFLLQDH